jgi:hypothetical protein
MDRTKNQVEAEMRHDLLVENTRRYMHNKQAAEQQAQLREQNAEEGRQVLARILEENRVAAERERLQQQNEARQQLESELKRKFMTLPGASESGWLVSKNAIIEAYFVERMSAQGTFEEAERAKYPPM